MIGNVSLLFVVLKKIITHWEVQHRVCFYAVNVFIFIHSNDWRMIWCLNVQVINSWFDNTTPQNKQNIIFRHRLYLMQFIFIYFCWLLFYLNFAVAWNLFNSKFRICYFAFYFVCRIYLWIKKTMEAKVKEKKNWQQKRRKKKENIIHRHLKTSWHISY